MAADRACPHAGDQQPFMGSDAPLVTIMIPTFGKAQYLSKAIESALSQDYPRLEVVVSDDASPDATASIAARYEGDSRFRYVRNPQNLGRVGDYRKTLAHRARGDFVLNLDGDDWLSDDRYISVPLGS